MIYLDLGLLVVHVLNGIMFRKNKEYKWSNFSWFFAGLQLGFVLIHLREMTNG
jgi:hypothetical protein